MLSRPNTALRLITGAAFGVMLGVSATMAQAQNATPLADQAEITEGLINTAIAYEIGQQCGSISARMIRGITYLNSLRDRARQLGYTNAEIDAFVDNRTEKRRLEGIARARLADMGAVVGNSESYCAVGRLEMAAGTAIGRLLR